MNVGSKNGNGNENYNENGNDPFAILYGILKKMIRIISLCFWTVLKPENENKSFGHSEHLEM